MSKNEENLVDQLKASIRSSKEGENEKNDNAESNQTGYNEPNRPEQDKKNKNQKINLGHILASSLADVVLIQFPKMFIISFLFMFIWNNALVENINQIPEIDYITSIIIYALANLLQSAK
jgi:hypothetical protein